MKIMTMLKVKPDMELGISSIMFTNNFCVSRFEDFSKSTRVSTSEI